MDRKGKTSKQQLKGTRFFVSIAIEWFCIRRFSCTGEAAAAAASWACKRCCCFSSAILGESGNFRIQCCGLQLVVEMVGIGHREV